MFRERNGALGLKADFWPKPFWNERPGQPIHGEAKVEQFPRMHIRADRSSLETSEQMLGLRFNDDTVPDRVQSPFLRCTPPAVLGGTTLGFDDGVKGVLPGPRSHARIRASQIGFGKVKIELRLAKGFIAGIQHRLASARSFVPRLSCLRVSVAST